MGSNPTPSALPNRLSGGLIRPNLNMRLTDYHAKYFAYELTKRCPSDSPERFSGELFDAPDKIDRRREQLIADIESRLTQKVTSEEMFMIQCKLV